MVRSHARRSGISSVDDLESESVSTGDIYTVSPVEGLSGLNDAVSSYDTVRLKPGGTYSGSTTVEIDPTDRFMNVLAWGATLDYTGSGVAVDILSNGPANAGPVRWFGGVITGPGMSATGSRGIRVTDSLGHRLEPSDVKNFEYGIELRNVDLWTEQNEIRNAGFNGCKRWIKFTPASETGGSGTGSYRNFEAYHLRGSIPDGVSYAIEVPIEAKPYQGRFVDIDAFFAGPDQVLLLANGDMNNVTAREFSGEYSGNGSNGTMIEYGGNGNPFAEVSAIDGLSDIDDVKGSLPLGAKFSGDVSVTNGGQLDSDAGVNVGDLAAREAHVTLDGSDSTTWVDVPIATNRGTSIVFAGVTGSGAQKSWVVSVRGDFVSKSLTELSSDGSLSNGSLEARIETSSLQVRSSATGDEGTEIAVGGVQLR